MTLNGLMVRYGRPGILGIEAMKAVNEGQLLNIQGRIAILTDGNNDSTQTDHQGD